MTEPKHDPADCLAQRLEALAAQVRTTPPAWFQIGDTSAVREVPPEESGNYNYRVREPAGPGQTTIVIQWSP